MLCFLVDAALGQNVLDGLSLHPFSLATPRGGGLFGQTNFPDFGAAWNPSSRDEGGSTDRDGGVERYQNGGFEDPPACSLLEPGLPRWLCGVVGQLPHIGLRISPADDPSTVLSLRIEGLMVSGLSVQDVHSAHHRTGNASLPPGFAAALDGIGFRVHLDSFEAPPLGAASASRGSGPTRRPFQRRCRPRTARCWAGCSARAAHNPRRRCREALPPSP